METPWDFHGCDWELRKKLKCGNQVPVRLKDSGENCECFYFFFFLTF